MTVELIRDLLAGSFRLARSVVAVGTFDGVHKGHRKVLRLAAAVAKERNAPAVALTFDPHPMEVLAPPGPGRLTTMADRATLLGEAGATHVVLLRFTPKLAEWSARDFVLRVLRGRLAASDVVVGFNFTFGRYGAGDADELRDLARELGFSVRVVSPLEVDGTVVSSSTIRTALHEGRVGRAGRLLGRPYRVSGPVVAGHGRGRDLGFPTANIERAAEGLIVPATGVYCGHGSLDGRTYEALIYVGGRPTFEGNGSRVLETHLVGYRGGSLEGRRLEVDFERWIREERVFPSGDDLRAQLERDLALVRGGCQGGDVAALGQTGGRG